ncbi:hypothetical protein MVEN_01290800 [Mycena venus]|uniref:Uncharacterized protein n=1 Tax=Mycena venus TaxID=2733690 RepID=A0A8H7CVV5_9AGAR|nr:hypothetical protein MVEN_01290800 [Mycena venus]
MYCRLTWRLFATLLFSPHVASATSFDLPLSSTFCVDHEKSLLSLDWVLASGIESSGSVASDVLSLPCEGSTCVMNVNLSIKDSLPFDLVLVRDWHLFCRDSLLNAPFLPNARFLLTSGILDFAPNPSVTFPPILACPMDVKADLDAGFPQRSLHLCACSEPSACSCASSSHALHSHLPKPSTTSLNVLRDILTVHYRTHAHISVLHSELDTIQPTLTLHSVPHHDMNLIQCRQALIHRLVTGACADHISDVVDSFSRLGRSTCRAQNLY